MNIFFLFLFNLHHLVSSSHPSASSSREENALLPHFKKLLSDAYAYNYYQATLDLMSPIPTGKDVFLKASEEIIQENNIGPVHIDIWKNIICTIALSNQYFLDVIPKHVSVKAMWFLAFVLDSFKIPNTLRDPTSQPDTVTRRCLGKLYEEYLGKQISETPINMEGIIVFLYIHTMNIRSGNYLHSELEKSSSVKQFHLGPNNRKSNRPYTVGRFYMKPKQKKAAELNQKVQVFTIPDAVPNGDEKLVTENDAIENIESVDNAIMKEESKVFEMPAVLNIGSSDSSLADDPTYYPYYSKSMPSSSLPYNVGRPTPHSNHSFPVDRFTNDPNDREVFSPVSPVNPVNFNEAQVFNIPGAEPGNVEMVVAKDDDVQIFDLVDNTLDEKDAIFYMLAESNSRSHLFEYYDARYMHIDIMSDRPQATQDD